MNHCLTLTLTLLGVGRAFTFLELAFSDIGLPGLQVRWPFRLEWGLRYRACRRPYRR